MSVHPYHFAWKSLISPNAHISHRAHICVNLRIMQILVNMPDGGRGVVEPKASIPSKMAKDSKSTTGNEDLQNFSLFLVIVGITSNSWYITMLRPKA